MKQLLLLISIICIIGCVETKKTPTTIITVGQDTITETVELPDKTILKISKSQYAVFNKFRPAIKDVAIFFLVYNESIRLDHFYFICGNNKIWVANGYNNFRLEHPVEMNFTAIEKKYFWNLYVHYKNNKLRLYEWESEIQIIKD
ncbi:hypothetical protein KAR91_25685 [Candidatus Pacearchaeota archaeon]|nr:hypothetical protein [Candidatus Pacearchaeota archaeon]